MTIDINQLKANSEKWKQIKKTAYAGSLGTNEQFDESIQKIAELAGLPDASPGRNYSEALRVRDCSISEDLEPAPEDFFVPNKQ